ncbi:probable disease resistance protein At4g27220 [Corylus avellana]|uniref:probable disease resistance protein At4g27220 n=1 Tax=Corylus avellana TaxID=13451 RepID=UPI001E226D95|nr:probable disease resistance protein At4g27220 [Corylus avellana]
MESILMECATKFLEWTVAPVGQWLCYSFHYKSNIGSMKNQEKKLGLANKRLQNSVEAARCNGLQIEGDVKKWLEEAEDVKIENLVRNVLEREEEEAKMKWYSGACLMKLKRRHQLSRKAKKIEQEIGKLLQTKPSSERVGFRPAPQGIVIVGSMDYVASKSRESTVTRLMEALEDDEIHLIGVWGMAGVGKSRLVREVANQAKEKKLFDEVVIANVTQSPDCRRIQGEIADTLRLKFDEETEPGRASRLLERLSQERKKPGIPEENVDLEAIPLQGRLTGKKDEKMILVILDDIWEKLDLEAIGIPSRGCKVLLISRDRNVLVSKMDTQKDIQLGVLDDEDAWSLFEKMAGDCVKDPNLQSTATGVAKACAGLPLALVTVSKALKNKELFEWKDALQLLRRPAPKHLTEMLSTIYSSIELSFKHLKESHKEALDVFLLCSQLGYYIGKDDLLKYCYGLGLFHGINTIEEAKNRLYKILRILEDCCLLQPYKSRSLCMHDVVRDATKSIAEQDHNMFVVRADGGLKEWLDANAFKRCETIYARGGDIHELPNKMELPELRFFCLWGEDSPKQISDNFFEGVGKLKVLDLTQMHLSSLPSSLLLLENLQTLCLDQCVLGDIAIVGKLKNLVVLSLLKSNISQLPEEIGLLTCLRLLDLTDCFKLELIPPNVLSSLIALEVLYMRNSFVQWEAEGLNNASLAELKHLSHLITLEIKISNASNLPKDLLFEKLERYVISIGDEWDWSDEREEASRTLKLKLNTSFQSQVGIIKILNKTENLYLDDLKGVKSVLHELDWEGFQQLKHLHIQNNREIKYIMNLVMPFVVFPALETFLLKNMTSLEEIGHGQLPNLTSFGKLRVVKVEHCDKLKYFFSLSIARGLSQLEELEIRECSIMGSIVMKEEGEIEDEDTASLFPQLRLLRLKHLPKLKSFLSIQNSLVTDAGEIIMEGKPDFHMPILHEQVVFPNLKRLELFSIGLEDIQHNQNLATRSFCRIENMQSTPRFQNLLDLDVKGSNNIKYLLSFSSARFMEQLKHLRIRKCEVMEEILVTEDLRVVGETIPKEFFPRLEILKLKKLPMLKRFCEGSNIKFPSLKWLIIDNCPKLKTFISKPVSLDMMTSCREPKEMNVAESPHTAMQPLFNEEVSFPCLEWLTIFQVDDLKIIWGNQFAVDSFYKLQDITVYSCENLLNVFRSDMLERFQSLEKLRIRDCHSLQEVFEVQGMNVKESHVVTREDSKPIFSFQNLQRVFVVECSSLKSLFPASMATCLAQLEKLVIIDCMVLEEIVVGEETKQPIARFVFPRVTVLHLVVLPRLKWFYPGVHTSEWPMLKNMLVAFCPKVKIFASELSSFKDILGESQVEIPSKQPLFLVDDEVPFPSLEKLRIFCMADLKIIWHNQFTANSFCKREIIKDEFCENLIVHQETCGVTATQLKELHLLHLPKLKHIWNKDPQEISSFQNPHEVHAIGGENMTFDFEHDVVKEIGLTYQNSGVSPEERIIEIDS